MSFEKACCFLKIVDYIQELEKYANNVNKSFKLRKIVAELDFGLRLKWSLCTNFHIFLYNVCKGQVEKTRI